MKKIALMLVLVMGLLTLVGCSTDNESKIVGEKHKLRVTVQDKSGNAINGATVAAGGVEGTASNTAELELFDGNYTVTVNADGYKEELTDVTINGEDSSITVKLAEDPLADFVLISSDGSDDINIDGDNANNNGNIHPDPWGTGTNITPDVKYDNKDAWELIAGGNWGGSNAVLAFMGDLYDGGQAEFPVDLTADSKIKFWVASTGDFDSLKVKLVGDEEQEIELDSFESQSPYWQIMELSVAEFDKVTPGDVTQIAIMASGGTVGESKVYITNYKITNAEVIIPEQ